jgi:hypothetical protein
VHGATSRPQLAWADVVYFRDRDAVLDRMRAAGGADAAAEKLAHILAMLLAYDVHDYAAELADEARSERLVDAETAADFASAVSGSLVRLAPYTLRGSVALVLALGAGVPLSMMGAKGRTVAGALVRGQAAPLFSALARASSRSGLKNSCLTDV